jgi:oligopeptide/dipeptide ABC transporter ATP-binding protein
LPTKRESTSTVAPAGHTIVDIQDLSVHFDLQGSAFARLFGRKVGTVKAVDGVNLRMRAGEVVGLVGESGSGKSTLGRSLLGLVPATSGSIFFEDVDIATMSRRDLREIRQYVQMIFQDPNAALNPGMTIEQAVGDPLRIHGMKSADERRKRVIDALERVGLSPVELFLSKYPKDLSGGQKQRVVIARAIILGPSVLVADEPISMLDMSVRAKILQLMLDLKEQLDLTYVYITHDLASAKFFCDRIAIMYLGRIVEIGDTAEIFANPKHPYTKALLAAIPDPDPERSMPRDLLKGEIPDAAEPPSGCAFHPRCPAAFDMCGWESRDLAATLESHWLRTGVSTFDVERSQIANLDGLGGQEGDAVLKAAGNGTPDSLNEMLDEVRRENPEARFWTGVDAIERDGASLTVHFHEGEDPRLRRAGNVQVACHLYPPEDE